MSLESKPSETTLYVNAKRIEDDWTVFNESIKYCYIIKNTL